ncbi:MAG TPA: hypothetical protein VMZ26_15510, partial [Pyrinomonadaceae bacterium]|nr:hypothetical protein [Pyrinomonadaceae bacterium]
ATAGHAGIRCRSSAGSRAGQERGREEFRKARDRNKTCCGSRLDRKEIYPRKTGPACKEGFETEARTVQGAKTEFRNGGKGVEAWVSKGGEVFVSEITRRQNSSCGEPDKGID